MLQPPNNNKNSASGENLLKKGSPFSYCFRLAHLKCFGSKEVHLVNEMFPCISNVTKCEINYRFLLQHDTSSLLLLTCQESF